MGKITAAEYAAKHNISPEAIYMRCKRGSLKSADNSSGKWLIDEDEPLTDNRTASITHEKAYAIGRLYGILRQAHGTPDSVPVPVADILNPLAGLTRMIAVLAAANELNAALNAEISEVLNQFAPEDSGAKMSSQQSQSAWWMGYYSIHAQSPRHD